MSKLVDKFVNVAGNRKVNKVAQIATMGVYVASVVCLNGIISKKIKSSTDNKVVGHLASVAATSIVTSLFSKHVLEPMVDQYMFMHNPESFDLYMALKGKGGRINFNDMQEDTKADEDFNNMDSAFCKAFENAFNESEEEGYQEC